MKIIIRYLIIPMMFWGLAVPGVGAMGSRPEMMTEYTESSQGPLRFYMQKVLIRDSLEQSNVEFSYSLAMDQLQFIAQGKTYKAGYTFSIIVYDRDGQQTAGDNWERTMAIPDYQHLQRGDSILTDTLVLVLPPGQYRAKIACRDDNSDRVGLLEVLINVPRLSGSGYIGGPRFERDYNGSIIPWPSRIYGDGAGPIIFRLYPLHFGSDSLALKARLGDLRIQKTVWERTQVISGRPGHEIRMIIPVDSLSDGNYQLTLALNDQKNNLLWQSQHKVMVQNPAILTKGDFEEKIAQVEYISRRGEYDTLKRAGIEQRDSLWRVFWKSRDPTPDTEKNEYRDAYYEKIHFANNNFGSSLRPGWRTDMGRVYIKFGQPDEIEKHPFETDSQPYEVWYYYQEGLKIIFLDRHGFGDYRIVYANKEI